MIVVEEPPPVIVVDTSPPLESLNQFSLHIHGEPAMRLSAGPFFFLLIVLSSIYLHLKLLTLSNANHHQQESTQTSELKAYIDERIKSDDRTKNVAADDQTNDQTKDEELIDDVFARLRATEEKVVSLEEQLQKFNQDNIHSAVEEIIRMKIDAAVKDSVGKAEYTLESAIGTMEELLEQVMEVDRENPGVRTDHVLKGESAGVKQVQPSASSSEIGKDGEFKGGITAKRSEGS